jgi:hypothetical protein
MIAVVAFTLAIAISAGQAPQVRASSDRYLVEALDEGGSGRPARVIISDQVTSRRHMLSINSTLGQLRRAIVRHDEGRVLLLCTNGFAVVDPTGQVPADEVYASNPVASGDGRWIAYQRFFPATHPGPNDGVALYDTRALPEKNHAAHPIPVEREWRAGWPVFPPASEWKDASAVTPIAEAYLVSSPLTWEGTKPEQALMFAMRRGDEDTVVLAVPAEGAPRVCWSTLPGSADRWRVKTLVISSSATSGGWMVRVKSGALEQAAQELITFTAGCAGPNR